MRDLTKIMVNSAKLKLIIGESINFPFPEKRVENLNGKVTFKKQSVSLSEVIATSKYANKRSFDERFDGKHPVTLAVDSIEEKGLSKTYLSSIFRDKASIKAKRLAGKWAVLNQLITDDHRKYINDRLTVIHIEQAEKEAALKARMAKI